MHTTHFLRALVALVITLFASGAARLPPSEEPARPGTILWSVAGNFLDTNPCLSQDGVLYAVSQRGMASTLTAFDAGSGAVRWRFTPGAEWLATPMLAGDLVLIDDPHRALHALDRRTGELRWSQAHDVSYTKHLTRTPDGSVWFGERDALVAVDPRTGHRTGRVPGLAHSSPVVGPAGTLYLGDNRNRLVAVDHRTRRELWHIELGNMHYVKEGSPAIGPDGTLYALIEQLNVDGMWASSMLAADPRGRVRWSTGGDMRFFHTGVAVAPDGTVLIGADDMLQAFDGATGARVWRRVEAPTATPTIGDDGVLYVGFRNEGTVAIDLRTSEVRWRAPRALARGPVALGPDGVLFACGRDGLFAIQTGSPGLARSGWPKARFNLSNHGGGTERP